MIVEAGIAEQGSAEAMIHDSNHNKTRYAHQLTPAALHILLEEAFEDYTSSSYDPLSFEQWRHKMREESVQFRFWDIALGLELIAMELLRSMRLGDFTLYKSALTKLVPWCFSLDHTNYSRWLPFHMKDLSNLPVLHPDLNKHFQAGMFVGRLSEREGSGVPWDHLHEDKNRDLKGLGGIIGLTEQREKLRKWDLVTPNLAEMNIAFEEKEKSSRFSDTQHHQASDKKCRDFQKHVSSLAEAFRSVGNPFMDNGDVLYNLFTGAIATEKVKDAVLRVEDLGALQYNTYVALRVDSNAVSLHDPIRQNKLPLFSSKQNAQPRVKAQVKSLKNTCKLFGALFVSAGDGNRTVEKNDFFSHEMEEYPPSLSLHGALRATNKADLMRCLMDGIVPDCGSFGPTVDAKVLDGAAIVHMLNPGGCRLFSDYTNTFLSFLQREAEQVQRVDIVWDRYDKDSLKLGTRIKRGEGMRRRVTPTSKIPVKGWQNFLRESENKQELFRLLSDGVKEVISRKILCSSLGDGVVFCQDTDSEKTSKCLAPCNHEEADTRIIVHVAGAVAMGFRRILIRTVDTDVVVIAVFSFQKLPDLDKLWVHIKAGKQNNFLPIHEIVNTLGPSKSLAMIGFHAFSGCDTVSSFYGIGKKTAWNMFKSYPEAAEAFIALAEGRLEECRPVLTNFVIALYSPSEMYPTLTMCRRALHTKEDRSADSLPPTEDTIDGHIKRASLQAQSWQQATARVQDLPSPAEWGWQRDKEGHWTPVWKTTSAKLV